MSTIKALADCRMTAAIHAAIIAKKEALVA